MSSSSLTNQQLQSLVNNLTSRFPKTSFTVAGKAFLASKVAALAQNVLTARTTVSTVAGNLVDARKAVAQVEAEAFPIVTAVRTMIALILSNDTSAQKALAVSSRKAPSALSPEQRLAATAKLRATRAVRGTMGPKQKAKLKGNVTGVVVTTVTSQGAAAPVPTSASPPTSPVATSSTVAAGSSAPETTQPSATPPATANLAATVGALIASGH